MTLAALAFLVAAPTSIVVVVVRWIEGSGRPDRAAGKAATGEDLPRSVAVAEADRTATIRITRKHQPWGAWANDLKIELDGQVVGILEEGDTVEVRVAPGPHSLRASSGREGGWGATSVHVPDGSSRRILISLGRDLRELFGGLIVLGLAMVLGGGGGPDLPTTTYRFEDAATADPGRPLAHPASLPWLILGTASIVALLLAWLLLDQPPFLVFLVLLIGLPTILLARLSVGPRKHAAGGGRPDRAQAGDARAADDRPARGLRE